MSEGKTRLQKWGVGLILSAVIASALFTMWTTGLPIYVGQSLRVDLISPDRKFWSPGRTTPCEGGVSFVLGGWESECWLGPEPEAATDLERWLELTWPQLEFGEVTARWGWRSGLHARCFTVRGHAHCDTALRYCTAILHCDTGALFYLYDLSGYRGTVVLFEGELVPAADAVQAETKFRDQFFQGVLDRIEIELIPR